MAAVRLQRWAIQLSAYQYEIRYRSFVKKSKGMKKKSGCKSAWSPEDVDDFIDIVVRNNY